jgi:hypothetical protein
MVPFHIAATTTTPFEAISVYDFIFVSSRQLQ